MSANPAQTPECQPSPVTAPPGTPTAAIRQANGAGPAGQDGYSPAWTTDAAYRNGQTAEPGSATAAMAEQASLVPGVSWSEQALKDLEEVVAVADVRDELRRNAEEILHNILSEWRPRCVEMGDAGVSGEVMWHRGVPHEHELLPEQADGPECYFLFYQLVTSTPAWEVLAVRSIYQVARRWERRSRSPLMRPIRSLKRRLPWGLRW